MTMVAWAPPRTNPVLTAVEAHKGARLDRMTYLEMMRNRVHQMLQKAGRAAAVEAVRTYLPEAVDIFSHPENQWAAHLMAAGEMIETRLGGVLPPIRLWPLVVTGQNPQAKEALDQVDLETWLNLAVPRENVMN